MCLREASIKQYLPCIKNLSCTVWKKAQVEGKLNGKLMALRLFQVQILAYFQLAKIARYNKKESASRCLRLFNEHNSTIPLCLIQSSYCFICILIFLK